MVNRVNPNTSLADRILSFLSEQGTRSFEGKVLSYLAYQDFVFASSLHRSCGGSEDAGRAIANALVASGMVTQVSKFPCVIRVNEFYRQRILDRLQQEQRRAKPRSRREFGRSQKAA
jgi:hypothetical protein